ncbi:MAG TPA: thermonuclease family protein [Pyrinomonadaceae bacterium]|nr:thermonuclease family protein [Pyrinomonadaceae bacterium]
MKNVISRMTKRTILAIGALALVFATSCSRTSTQPNRSSNRSVDASGTQTLTGRVVSIADGDTITVLDSSDTQHRIRLAGIDAPELHQAFGEQSRLSLSEMIFGKDVSVSYQKIDQYGRLVGKILLDGKDINLEQVKAGMAWHYKEYQREQTPEDRDAYAKAEDEARAARRGLWQDPNPVEPSAFRKEEKRERQNAR